MHVTQVHPLTSDNQFHCTRLYVHTHGLTLGAWNPHLWTLMCTDTHHTYAHGHINAWQGVCPWHCKCRTIFALIRRWMHPSKQLSLCFIPMENLMVWILHRQLKFAKQSNDKHERLWFCPNCLGDGPEDVPRIVSMTLARAHLCILDHMEKCCWLFFFGVQKLFMNWCER